MRNKGPIEILGKDVAVLFDGTWLMFGKREDLRRRNMRPSYYPGDDTKEEYWLSPDRVIFKVAVDEKCAAAFAKASLMFYRREYQKHFEAIENMKEVAKYVTDNT